MATDSVKHEKFLTNEVEKNLTNREAVKSLRGRPFDKRENWTEKTFKEIAELIDTYLIKSITVENNKVVKKPVVVSPNKNGKTLAIISAKVRNVELTKKPKKGIYPERFISHITLMKAWSYVEGSRADRPGRDTWDKLALFLNAFENYDIDSFAHWTNQQKLPESNEATRNQKRPTEKKEKGSIIFKEAWEKNDEREFRKLEEEYYTRKNVCRFLHEYYGDSNPILKPYKFSINGGETQTTSIYTSKTLCDKEIIVDPNIKTFHVSKENIPFNNTRSIKEYAMYIEKKIKKLGIDIWDDPSFRLVEFNDLNSPILFTLVRFLDYRFSSGLLEDELIQFIIDCQGDEKAMMQKKNKMFIRNELLPDLSSIKKLKKNRICAGGLGVLLALKEGDHYSIHIQKRSSKVSDGRGKYALFPKGFHQPFDEMNLDIEVNIFHTVMKEVYEEALSKNKREEKSAYKYNWYYDRSATMKWVKNHPDDVTVKITSLGLMQLTEIMILDFY